MNTPAPNAAPSPPWTARWRDRGVWLVAAGAVLVTLAVGVAWATGMFSPGRVHVTAYFERATGIYPSSDVRILGVKVGSVDSISPAGSQVRVQLSYDADHKVPADAMAAIVAPSLVSGRYIQLAPVYRGGPVMADGATIPVQRTAVPVEWDQIKSELTRLSQALGPNGSDRNGAVHDLVNSASAALDGNAVPIKDTMDQLTRAAGGLADDSGNLFTTIRNLNDFVGALNHSGEKVRQFSNELASISALLDQNRHELATLLSTADGTLGRVTSFARDNKDRLGEAVSGLTDAAQQLSDNQINVANVLHLAPTTLANFYNIYNPTDATFTGRAMIAQVNGLANTACQAMFSLGGTLRDCQSALAPLLDQFNMENAPITLNPVEQAGTPNQQGPGAAHTTTPGAPGQVPVNRSPLIPLLGGPTG